MTLTLPDAATLKFRYLTTSYRLAEIEFPHLKSVTLAQWALESGWGTSDLAQKYWNYAGMKWRPYMKPFATPVRYRAWDGTTDYCNFATHLAFIEGYWRRLDLSEAYPDWRKHTHTPLAFMSYVGLIWVGGKAGMKPGTDYVRDVMRIENMVAQNFKDDHDATAPDDSGRGGPDWGRLRPDTDFAAKT